MRLVKQYLMAGAVALTVLSLTACGSAAESRGSSTRPAEQAKAAAQQTPAAEQIVRQPGGKGLMCSAASGYCGGKLQHE